MRMIPKHIGWIAGAGLSLCVGMGCNEEAGRPIRADGNGASLRLALTPGVLLKSASGDAAAIDSLRLRITGEDMAPVEFGRGGDSLTVSLDGLPPGDDRLVNAWLYRQGRLLYAGQGVFSFRREARLEAGLVCEPQFSRVTARFHLPLGLSAPVRGGELRLQGPAGEFSAPLRVEDEFGSFRADELPGDASYDISMVLTDSAGKERYRAERQGAFLPLGEESQWDMQLLPVDAAAGFSLGLGTPRQTVVRTGFPARRRIPAREGEAVVSAFLAAPAAGDSGSEGEWFSLYNRTADTLDLAGCRLGRDRSTGVTRSYPFPAGTALPPGGSLAFGRAAARADFHYADFSLVITASSLLLLCSGDSLAVDSLRYSAASADSAAALPMKEGWITRLSAGALSRRDQPSSWCLAAPAATVPGDMGECP